MKRLALALFASVLLPSGVSAGTIWNGPSVSSSDATQPDGLTANVALARGGAQGLYNSVSESGFVHTFSPADTEWADGTTANINLTYTDWNTWAKGVHAGPPSTVGVNAVLHLITDDIYLDIKFTSWDKFGPYSYIRSTPAVANTPPSVALASPANGTTLVALVPATTVAVTLAATASDTDGSVTNVQFFDGATLLGSDATSPYSLGANLAIGGHSLTAVATDNLGATNLSAVVTVTVVSNTVPTVSLLTPTNNSFFTAPAKLILAASATNALNPVVNVTFFDGTSSLGSATNLPFSLIATLPVGVHSLKAVATDALGTTNATTVNTVTVIASNIVVNAPKFASLTFSNKSPSAPLTAPAVPIVTNGLATLRWTADARSQFDLLYSTNLANSNAWKVAQANIPGSLTGTNVLSDPPYLASPAFRPNQNLFYRLNAAPPQSPGLPLRLQVVATNLIAPTVLTHAHDGSGRLFIAEQTGQIRIVDNTGALLATPFLDISNKLVTLTPGYDERGLLGLAFHPGYATNGRVFVYYSAPSPTTNFNNVVVLSEFTVSSTNANVANPNSERILLSVNEPEFNHEGADIVFGPDGFLYLGLGDGGGAGDQHGTDGNAQLLTTLLGKMLRLDVNSGSPYGIPTNNPFLSVPGARPEIFAYGLRNPWRFSFDRGGSHQGFIADVGQNFWEELDLLRSGANYGWRIIEGHHSFDYTTATALGVNVPALDYPIHEYAHGPAGIAIIGGYVYRGTNYNDLVGQYVFGDFSTSFGGPDGQLYYLAQTRPGLWERFPFQLWPNGGRLNRFVKGFGEDEAGDIYLLSTTVLGPTGRTGDIRRLVAP